LTSDFDFVNQTLFDLMPECLSDSLALLKEKVANLCFDQTATYHYLWFIGTGKSNLER